MFQQDSVECSKSELEMQTVPPTMTTMIQTKMEMYHPIASLDSYHAPIEFVVPAQTEYYTDLSQSNLYLKFRILKEDGSNLDDDQKAGPINNFLHSMFNGIGLFLNNKLVTSSMDTYPYRAYIENLFSYGSDVKSNQLKAGEFRYPDAAGKFEDHDSATVKARNVAVGKSIPVELWGRLHLDLAMQEKYLPNGIEIKIRLSRASPRFCILSDDPCVVKIDEAALEVRHIQLLPAISNELNQSIVHHNAKFPIRRVEVKSFTIGTGLRSKVEDHLFQGQLPKRIFIGMVTNETFNGAYNRNPFVFQPFNLSKLDVSCDGQSIYGKLFEPKFESNNYLRSYMSIYQALGNQLQNCNIDYKDYKSGYCFWGCDLTPDQGADQGHLHPIKTGNLRLELQFASTLDSTINVIVYAEFDNRIDINIIR